jgi:hypothetical protein
MELPTFADAGEGGCDDCGQIAASRELYNELELCRKCAFSRYRMWFAMSSGFDDCECIGCETRRTNKRLLREQGMRL